MRRAMGDRACRSISSSSSWEKEAGSNAGPPEDPGPGSETRDGEVEMRGEVSRREELASMRESNAPRRQAGPLLPSVLALLLLLLVEERLFGVLRGLEARGEDLDLARLGEWAPVDEEAVEFLPELPRAEAQAAREANGHIDRDVQGQVLRDKGPQWRVGGSGQSCAGSSHGSGGPLLPFD